jgi:hypothetical protein
VTPSCYNRSVFRVLAAVMVSGSLLVACGDDTDTNSTTTVVSTTSTTPTPVTSMPSVTTTTVAPRDRLTEIVEAVASGDPDRIVAQSAFVPAGSPAAGYLAHQLDVARLAPAVTTSATSSLTSVAGTVILCRVAGVCTRFDAPVAEDGQLVSFDVDGVAVRERVAGPGAETIVDGVAARVLSAYRSPSGGVSVILVLTNSTEAEVTPFGFAAVHRPRSTSSGVRRVGEVVSVFGPEVIEPGRAGRMLLVFPDASVDGDIVMNVVVAPDRDLTIVAGLVTP